MRKTIHKQLVGLFALGALALVGGCSSSSKQSPDGGGTGGTGAGLRSFTAPSDPGGGGVLFAASGEVLAFDGYGFPPNPEDSPAFVDGWQVQFTRLLATFDKIQLLSNPDVDPGNQSLTGPTPGSISGGLVAEADGPWAVDLAHAGPENIEGKGDPGVKAVPIAALKTQNKNGNGALATDGTRYAFSFDVVNAASNAFNVNLDAAAVADYNEVVADQCAVLYVGTATFKGGTVPGFENCNAGHTPAEGWPPPNTPITFHLCFKSPTSYRNCQNADLTGAPLGQEEFQRGIPLSSSQSTLAQVTMHTDHPFWDSILHDAPAHFDQFAARLVGQVDAGTSTVTLEMTKGVPFAPYSDARTNTLTWRYCIQPGIDVHAQFNGPMNFDRGGVPFTTGNDANAGLRDYYDFATYNQSTQGHLNADGLCDVKRNYDSPM
jgi:hypothetical protein